MAVLLVKHPVVIPFMRTVLLARGVRALAEWVDEVHPECGIGVSKHDGPYVTLTKLLGHDIGGPASSNEARFGVEIAGRSCYHSWGKKAGRKDTRAYIAHTQEGDVPHLSLLYHPRNTYFIAGVSRRLAKEMQRNYIGHAREEEGCPSQESSRYTRHPGHFVVPPRILDKPAELAVFEQAMQSSYDGYLAFLEREGADDLKGMDRKRVYEAAMNYLPEAAATSFVWSTNPAAEMKLWKERCAEAADLEFQRLAKLWRHVAVTDQPDLYPGVTP